MFGAQIGSRCEVSKVHTPITPHCPGKPISPACRAAVGGYRVASRFFPFQTFAIAAAELLAGSLARRSALSTSTLYGALLRFNSRVVTRNMPWMLSESPYSTPRHWHSSAAYNTSRFWPKPRVTLPGPADRARKLSGRCPPRGTLIACQLQNTRTDNNRSHQK